MCADSAAARVTPVFMEVAQRRVRNKTAIVRVASYVWLNDRCRIAIDTQVASNGMESVLKARDG